MVSASTTTATANVLIGRTGGEASYQRLVAELRGAGCVVTERTSSPIGAHSSSEDASGLLEQVDMAFLVVREADDAGSIGPVRPFQRVARDVGIIQGTLGMDRVVLLVEDEVGGLSTDLGVSVLRLPKSGPEFAAPEILQRIRQVVPNAGAAAPLIEPGIHDRLARIERSRADDEIMPFILFGVVAMAALLGMLFVALSLLGGDDGGGDDEDVAVAVAGRARLIDVTASLRTSSAAAGVGTPGSSASTETPGIIVSADEVPSFAAPDPAGPSAAFGGSDQLFPASCRVDLSKASLLDAASDCDGAGVLVLEGSPGPWHNEVVAFALSDGVAGDVVYERTGAVQRLEGGLVVLDRTEAAYGLGTLTISFSAAGQHVHLLDGLDDGSREATLTLRLER